jgi:hypothetical protein
VPDAILETLSPEQRAAIQSLINDRANEKFAKMKEEFFLEEEKKTSQTPKLTSGKSTGLTTARGP